ncbi:uncharacterized protein CTRU02_204437 [Colletotrichum truncatum]|uniref:Uncharacterized protein n=1 Tax=Colletotrichum truncatum TaxID=5467 RepID=A0ACC3ZC78_COLTU|nr:uncharacterized protein CTRU02_14421 [Colletotrichum truncatum]KAF6782233.1 hypothetical protein CTRU02_14421 [Colletotrichum truncatum]
MSPTSISNASTSDSAHSDGLSGQPGAVVAAICVAFALLFGLTLYQLGCRKRNTPRQTVFPGHVPRDEQQSQYGILALRPLDRSPRRDLPTRPPLAKIAHSKLDMAAQLAAATTCSVCLDDFVAGTLVAQLPCGHIFCSECIESWLMKRGATCPLWYVVMLRVGM